MKKRLQKIISVILMILMIICSCACAQNPNPAPEPQKPAEQTGEEENSDDTADIQATMEAYQFALQQLLFEHVWPDGSDCYFDNSFGSMEENSFAIYDVNSDGKDELVILFSTAPMAGMTAMIYGYEAGEEQLKEEFCGFPALTFYQKGILKENWSHNQGLAGENFWPYNLHGYDAENSRYELIAEVDSWDRSISEKNYSGESFPEDKDEDGDGVIYLITTDGNTQIADNEQYLSWSSEIIGEQFENIEFKELTEANIKDVA